MTDNQSEYYRLHELSKYKWTLRDHFVFTWLSRNIFESMSTSELYKCIFELYGEVGDQFAAKFPPELEMADEIIRKRLGIKDENSIIAIIN